MKPKNWHLKSIQSTLHTFAKVHFKDVLFSLAKERYIHNAEILGHSIDLPVKLEEKLKAGVTRSAKVRQKDVLALPQSRDVITTDDLFVILYIQKV